MASWYDSVEATNNNTVTLRSAVPRPATFDFFESFNMGDRVSLEAGEATKAIGTGAFKLGEWRPGDRFNMVKNPAYWEPGKPLLDEQVYGVGIEPQTLIVQFESNALDVVVRPAIRDFIRFRDSGSAQAIVHQSSGAYYALGYNTTWKPFDDKRVRQAMTWALDRDAFAKTVLQGTIVPYSLPWGPASVAYEKEKRNHYKFDLKKAKALVDAAGVGTFEPDVVMTPENPEMREMSEIYQQYLAKIEVKLNIRQLETANFVNTINSQPPANNGLWFANASRSNLGSPLTTFTSTSVLWGTTRHKDGFGINNTGYYSDQYKNTIDALILESDPAKQKSLYSRLNDIVLEDCWIAFLGPKPPRIAAQKNVKNIQQWPATEGFHYMDTWLA